MVGHRPAQRVGESASVCIIQMAIRRAHVRLRINVMESWKGAADKAGPVAGVLIEIWQDNFAVGRVSACSYRRRISTWAANRKLPRRRRQPIVFGVKRRLVGRIQHGKNGHPVGIVLEILRAEIQQHGRVAQAEKARISEKIGLRIKHGLLRMGNGAAWRIMNRH